MALDSETLDQLLSTVRRFVQARLVPNEQRVADEDAIPDDIAPAKIELCGNYALKIVWNDGHATGLYTWQRLAQLSGGSQSPG